LENALAKIASKEKAVRSIATQSRKESQMRHCQVLHFVNDGEFKRRRFLLRYGDGELGEKLRLSINPCAESLSRTR
jgi:hypothetical protein